MGKILIRIEKGKEINELTDVGGGILTHVYLKDFLQPEFGESSFHCP